MKLSVYTVLVIVASCSGAVPGDRDVGPPKAGDQRYLQVYGALDQTGASYEFTDNSPDLSAQGVDNILVSSCAQGMWFIYDETNYAGLWCYIINADHCFNWSPDCRNLASSLRYAGSPYGLNDNYYNLYDFEYTGGEELGGNTDRDSLGSFDLRTSSLVITGQAEWTLYAGLGYTGPSVCVSATNQVAAADGVVFNYALFGSMSEVGLPDNTIRSIAKGCYSDRVVGAPRINITSVHGL